MKRLRWLIPVVALWGLAFLIVRREWFWWWFEVHTGTHNESGPYYGFWSGFGSDLGEYVILGAVFNGLYLHWKHINCQEPRCPRVGLHQAAGGVYHYCTRHHPEHAEYGGKLPPADVRHRKHWEHVAATRGTVTPP